MSNQKSAQQGLVYVTIAKASFIVFGLGLQLLLPRFLGQAQYGTWTQTMTVLSTFTNIVVTATIQMVSHFSQRHSINAVKKTALKLQFFLGGSITLLLVCGAPLVAYFVHDPNYTLYIRMGGGVVLCYSIYCVFVGAANGGHEFNKQAGLDILFSSIRLLFVAGMAYLFHSVIACYIGFVAAALLITPISILLVGWPTAQADEEKIPLRSMAYLIRWLLFYLLFTNLLMFSEGHWLKRIATEKVALWNHLSLKDASTFVETYLIGPYSAVQNVARLPYQLILAATFVIFPLLSRSKVNQDEQKTREYIKISLRYSLMAVVGVAIALGVQAKATLLLLFKPELSSASSSLQFLLIAYVCFSMIVIIGTILNSLGKIKETTFAALGTLICMCCTLYLCLCNQPSKEQLLVGASQGTLLGMCVGLGLILVLLWRTFKITFEPLSLVRIGFAACVGLMVGWIWPKDGVGLLQGKIGTILCAGACVVVYTVILMVTRELSLKEVFSARKKPIDPAIVSDSAAFEENIEDTLS